MKVRVAPVSAARPTLDKEPALCRVLPPPAGRGRRSELAGPAGAGPTVRSVDVLVVPVTASAATSGFFSTEPGLFLLSPGFGGLAALVGVLVAYLAVRRQSADTRAKIDADRAAVDAAAAVDAEKARQERWWQTLTWIYDRATAQRHDARLTVTLTLRLLDRLSRQAHTEIEYEAVLGLIEAFTDERQAP